MGSPAGASRYLNFCLSIDGSRGELTHECRSGIQGVLPVVYGLGGRTSVGYQTLLPRETVRVMPGPAEVIAGGKAPGLQALVRRLDPFDGHQPSNWGRPFATRELMVNIAADEAFRPSSWGAIQGEPA